MTVLNASRQTVAALSECAILLVTKADTQVSAAAGLLQAGFSRLLFASNADQVLCMAADEQLDLVLLDLPISGLDAVALCAALRTTSGHADLPILALVSIEDSHEQLRLLAADTADLIVKPLSDWKLIARVILQLEQRLLVRNLQDFQHRTAAELATARDMQRALLPDDATLREIKERYNVDIAATFKPSTELGGDLWGAWPIDATRIGVFMCDVSGHGTIAAINTFRLHTIMARNDFDRSDPGRFLSSLNDRLTGLLVVGQYVTMLYTVVDTRNDCLTYAAAGSPEPLLALPGCQLEGLDGSGLPLGIVAGITYPTHRVDFGPGARLMLLSDALSEARLKDGTFLGDDAARAMVSAALAHGTSSAIVTDLTDNLSERAGDQLDDDLTLICIDRPARSQDHGHGIHLLNPIATAGRLLVVDHKSPRRLLVQNSAAALGLAVDAAPDFTCASRFLAEYQYDLVAVDVTPAPEEWLELFRTIASTNRRARLLLIGAHCDLAKLLATSLSLQVSATLKVPTDDASLRALLSDGLANDAATLSKSPHRAMTEADLHRALAEGEIVFGFQPQVSLTTGRLIGAEALARWTSPEYGAVPSNVLMSLLANGNASTLLTDVTLRTALAACSAWRKVVAGVSVAVNFSAASLAESDLISLVTTRLCESKLSPDALTVEVAEADAACSLSALAALRGIGVSVSLDGFGHGETSLSLLGQLPVGIVKIGRSVIQHCATEPEAVRLLRAITAAARAFDLTVAAVGVEVHAVEQTLRESGCDFAQGWLYGPAMPANAISRLLAAA